MPDAIRLAHGIRSRILIALLLALGCRESGKENFIEKVSVYNQDWKPDSLSLASLGEILNYARDSDSSQQNGLADRIVLKGNNAFHKLYAAEWLAKESGRDLYRIDLNRVVSKYISETEKNLDGIFSRAEDKGWILFFDEGDALFSRGSAPRNEQGGDAGMALNYLLEKTDNYDGIVILSTTGTGKIDSLQLMRFRKIVEIK